MLSSAMTIGVFAKPVLPLIMDNATRHKSRQADSRFSQEPEIDAETIIKFKPINN